MKVEGVLLVVREKTKKEFVATFLDVCGVFAPKFCHFSQLPSKIKVNHAFKAKTEAFRELFCAKVKKGPFCDHFTLRNPERDENGFWKKILPNLMPNPGSSAT